MRAAVSIWLGLLAVGCATDGPQKAPPPPKTWVEEVERAAKVAAAQPTLVLRYNPVTCSCPPFEVQIGSRWARALVDDLDKPGSPASLLLERAIAERKARRVGQYTIKGKLNPSSQPCGQGAVYLTVSVVGSE